jgi:hypothetical protein
LTFNELPSVIFQKIELSITAAVRTSNPTSVVLFATGGSGESFLIYIGKAVGLVEFFNIMEGNF